MLIFLLLVIATTLLFGAAVVRGAFGILGVYALIASVASAIFLLIKYFFPSIEIYHLSLGGLILLLPILVLKLHLDSVDERRRTERQRENERRRAERQKEEGIRIAAMKNPSKERKKFLKQQYKDGHQ